MATHDHADIAGHQHEVQRLLGRCLLRLQQYERLLKSMLAVQHFSGTPETIQHVLEARRAEFSGKTLGALVGHLMGDYIMREGSDPPDFVTDDHSDAFHASFRSRMNLPDESYEWLRADLRELVALRNMLVHNFIDFHDLWTIDGCVLAQDALVRAYAAVDRHVEQLRTFAEEMDASRKRLGEMMQTPMFLDVVLNGITPDGQIHWPIAGIVGALRQAHKELHVDGGRT